MNNTNNNTSSTNANDQLFTKQAAKLMLNGFEERQRARKNNAQSREQARAAVRAANKSTAQLHAEFKQRQAAEQAAKAQDKIEQANPDILFFDEQWLDENMINALSFQPKSTLVSKVKTALACSLIRSALLRQLLAPAQLSLALCNHPCFCLLFDTPQRRKLLANQAPLNWQTFEQPTELHQLSHQLKAALPQLASDFENQTGLGEVWQEAVLTLLSNPFPCSLLDSLSSADFAAYVLANYQMSAAKQSSHLLKTGKKRFFPSRLLARVYSWCVLRRVIKGKSKGRPQRRKGYQF